MKLPILARMNWWTVEYGLVGDINNPKIYGAGLLSSVGELKIVYLKMQKDFFYRMYKYYI